MNFKPHTQDELKNLNIQHDKTYLIEYLNKDYFNGEETVEQTQAKALINDKQIVFIAPDPYDMDRFIHEVRVIK